MKRIIIGLITVFSFFSFIRFPVYGQACDPTTPSFVINLTGNPDSIWVSPSVKRDGLCCSASGTDRCVEFYVTLDPKANGIRLDMISGAIPPGALFYEVECANPTQVGDTLCLSGVGPHRLTFCKPGNNPNEYAITSIGWPGLSDAIVVSDGCIDSLFVTGLVESTIKWRSVPNNPVYDGYLSCTTACDTVIVTAQEGAPSYVDYEASGLLQGACASDTIYDTTRVYFVSDKFAQILPDTPVICFGGTNINLTANGSGGAPPYFYLWNTGATTATINVAEGTSWVKITDSTKCPPVYDTVVVTADTSEIMAEAGPDQTICSDNPVVNLTGEIIIAAGGIWTGGDGTYTPSADSLTTTYTPTNAEINSGSVTLKLTTTGNAGCHAGEDSLEIMFSPPVATGFSFLDVCYGDTVKFNNTSTYPDSLPVSWLWRFGDGNTSSQKDPAYKYASAGTYNVLLKITSNSLCSDSVTKTVTVYAVPAADFTSDAKCFTDSVGFTDMSAITGDTITSWSWDFGNGDADAIQNPSVLYDSSGTYTVTLIVGTDFGCSDTVSKNVEVHPKPVADFSFNEACFGDSTTFNDISSVSSGSITSWNWDFGDGTGDTLQNEKHEYLIDTVYDVRLIVSSGYCSDTVVKQVDIFSPPTADFTSDAKCFSDSVHFIDISVITGDTISSWYWDFGNGITDSVKNPFALYDSGGVYTVTLIVSIGLGCSDTVSKNIEVYPSPDADFSFNNACFGDSTEFNDQSSILSGNIISWKWNFGDGTSDTLQNEIHLYQIDSIYNVRLIVASAYCSDTIIKQVDISSRPTADFTSDAFCFTDSVKFMDMSATSGDTVDSWLWAFGNGDSSLIKNPSVLYDSGGVYTVTLIVSIKSSCSDTVSKDIEVHPRPDADFYFNDVCLGDTTVFNDSSDISIGSIISWDWDFGDGTSDTLQNEVHLYQADSVYNVRLIVASAYCSDTVVKQVNVFPLPTADFTNDALCFVDSVHFADLSVITGDTIDSWSWDFGNGGSDTLQDPSFLYGSEGAYTVALIVTATAGCSDTVSKDIEVRPKPDADFGFSEACLGSNTVFNDSSSILSGTIISWDWDFGDGISGNLQNEIHKYLSDSAYNVTLIVASAYCSDTVVKQVTISPTPVAGFSFEGWCLNEITHCIDESTIEYTNIINWNWSFGDGVYDSVQNPSHYYSVAGGYIITLIVESDKGCTDTISKAITMTAFPVANFTIDKIIVYPKENIHFTDLSTDAFSWSWDFGDSTGYSTLQNPVYAYGDTGVYTVVLIITDDIGCTDTIYKVIIVQLPPNIPDAYTPNGDGKNDVLRIKGGPFTTLDFKIYNEWGELIFVSHNQRDGWNGKYKGKDCPVGVYVYTFYAIGEDGKVYEGKGDVTLIR